MSSECFGPRPKSRGPGMLLAACGAYVFLLAYVPEASRFSPIFCPSHRWLGLNCATCGMTRAMACLIRLDPVSHVMFNPLVVLIGPLIVLWIFDTSLRLSNREGFLSTVPHRLTRSFWRLLGIALVAVWVVRAVTWLQPDLNPHGWFIPPEEFPVQSTSLGRGRP